MNSYTKTYTVPERELTAILNLGMSLREARSGNDGALASWIERARFERDGYRWVTLQERGQGYAIEIAIDEVDNVLDAIALLPDEARALDR
jgi:hypothetical protein